jgi:Holliday junction DNA helicase RuvA
MIGRLKGQIAECQGDSLLVEVQGVGYEVYPPSRSLVEFRSHLGESIVLWIYTHVREEALQLFGFSTRDEKDLFLQLLKVNGVGPKLALNILSGASCFEITEWIETGDAKAFSKIPKVGKKIAEQIILTLQGQLVRIDPPLAKNAKKKEIHFALTNLGFKPSVVDEFLATLGDDIGVEEGIRQGLSQLSQMRGNQA